MSKTIEVQVNHKITRHMVLIAIYELLDFFYTLDEPSYYPTEKEFVIDQIKQHLKDEGVDYFNTWDRNTRNFGITQKYVVEAVQRCYELWPQGTLD